MSITDSDLTAIRAIFEKARAQAAFVMNPREGMRGSTSAVNSHKWSVRCQGISIAEQLVMAELETWKLSPSELLSYEHDQGDHEPYTEPDCPQCRGVD